MSSSTEKGFSNNGEGGYLAKGVIMIAFVLSLSMGFLDIAISMLSKPSGFSSFQSILIPLTATISIFCLVYVILWFFLISHVARALKLEAIPVAISFALFLGALFTLGSLNDIIHPSLSLPDLFTQLIVLGISLLISMGAYFVTGSVAQVLNYRNTVVACAVAIPFVLAEMVLFMWVLIYRIGSFPSILSLVTCLAYVLLALMTVWLFYRVGHRIRLMRLVAICMALVVLSPLVTIGGTSDAKGSLEGLKVADHPIRHVILISVDTLRADALSSYNEGASTPHIDQLAADGILFTKAISAAPWTVPAIASIMTGVSPSVHMMIRAGARLSERLPTLAEYMREAGYFTGAVVRNWHLSPKTNISQGFAEYHILHESSLGESFGTRVVRRLIPGLRAKISTRDITNVAIKWLESNYNKDFFLWIHYLDPHGPYAPPKDFLPNVAPPPSIGGRFENFDQLRLGTFVPTVGERTWIKELYDGEVRYVDNSIGRILDKLKELGLYNESLIIFTSDHGEEFWEHGGVFHANSLYDELLWVPLIIKLPLAASKGQINRAVPTQALMSTILQLCEIDYEGNGLAVDSLSSLWETNDNGFDGRAIISEGQQLYDDQESAMFDGLKYIRSRVTQREELYDLASDPGEQISIAHVSPDKVERGRTFLREHEKTATRLRERYGIGKGVDINLDEETMRRLRALGYLQ